MIVNGEVNNSTQEGCDVTLTCTGTGSSVVWIKTGSRTPIDNSTDEYTVLIVRSVRSSFHCSVKYNFYYTTCIISSNH